MAGAAVTRGHGLPRPTTAAAERREDATPAPPNERNEEQAPAPDKPRHKRSTRALRKERGTLASAGPELAATDDSALLERLRHHALGMVDMSSTQVRAAEVALKKAEAADETESHAVRKTISWEPLTEAEWQQKYCS